MRSFTASNSRPRLSAALALFAAAGIALPTATADITTTVDAREGPSRNSLTKVPLAPGSIASSVTCRAKIPNPAAKRSAICSKSQSWTCSTQQAEETFLLD